MVHQFKQNGYNIVLDTCSGSVHVVDEVAYDIISMYKEKTEDKIVSAILEKYKDIPDVNEDEVRECIADVKELEENKTLHTRRLRGYGFRVEE